MTRPIHPGLQIVPVLLLLLAANPARGEEVMPPSCELSGNALTCPIASDERSQKIRIHYPNLGEDRKCLVVAVNRSLNQEGLELLARGLRVRSSRGGHRSDDLPFRIVQPAQGREQLQIELESLGSLYVGDVEVEGREGQSVNSVVRSAFFKGGFLNRELGKVTLILGACAQE